MSIKYDFLLPGTQPLTIGKNLYLLGTSEDGPLFEPRQIKSKEHARSIFGSKDQGTLVRAFEQAYDINDEISIFLMRITGKSATLKLEGFEGGVLGNVLSLKTIYGGSKYNDIQLRVEYRGDEEFLIIFETESGTIVYRAMDYPTMGHLVHIINNDCRSGIHRIQATTDFEDRPTIGLWSDIPEPMNFSGGEDGTLASKDELYIACDTAYNLLLGTPIDVIVPCGMYVDDVHPTSLYGVATYGSGLYASGRDYLTLVDTYQDNKIVSYHEQLIEFCREQSKLGYMSHGVIGIAPLLVVPESIEHDNLYILRLVEATAFRDRYGFSEFKDGQWVDKGFYISVFGSEVVFNSGTSDEYFDSGAVTYAALLTNTFDTTTNLRVPGDITLRYELSEHVMSELSKLGVTTYRDSVRLGLVVNNGVTAAEERSDLHDVANVRMVQLSLAYVNHAVEAIYQSEINPVIRRQILDDTIRERLEELKTLGVVTGYDFNVVLNNDQTYGVVMLNLKTKYTVTGVATSAEISYMGGEA